MKKKIFIFSLLGLLITGCGVVASADVSSENNVLYSDIYADKITYNTTLFDVNHSYSISTNGIISNNSYYQTADSQTSTNTNGGESYTLDVTNEYISNRMMRTFESPEFEASYCEYVDISIEHNFVLNNDSYFRTFVPSEFVNNCQSFVTLLQYRYIDNEYQLVPINRTYDIDLEETIFGSQFDINDLWVEIFNEFTHETDLTEFVVTDLIIRYYTNNSPGLVSIAVDEQYFTYDDYIKGSNYINILNNQIDFNVYERDYTSWLITAVGGFMAFEIVPGFTIGGVFSVIVMITLLIYILKMFLGG